MEGERRRGSFKILFHSSSSPPPPPVPTPPPIARQRDTMRVAVAIGVSRCLIHEEEYMTFIIILLPWHISQFRSHYRRTQKEEKPPSQEEQDMEQRLGKGRP